MFEKMTGLVTMFKVGDLVQVRHHTEEEKEQYLFKWTDQMDKLEGYMFRIHQVIPGGYRIYDGDRRWSLKEDSLRFICLEYDQF